MYRELLIGCGARRVKDLWIGDLPPQFYEEFAVATLDWETLKEFQNVTTLDINATHNPDIVFDLSHIRPAIGRAIPECRIPYPQPTDNSVAMTDNVFDEIHAYEVLEHIGAQGDYQKFFAQFNEFHRILKPGGFLFATCPAWFNIWAWGDPGHTRVISDATLVFLDQNQYKEQVGKTSMSDYRHCYTGDFETVLQRYVPFEQPTNFQFILRARK